jgi:hypothetical protein
LHRRRRFTHSLEWQRFPFESLEGLGIASDVTAVEPLSGASAEIACFRGQFGDDRGGRRRGRAAERSRKLAGANEGVCITGREQALGDEVPANRRQQSGSVVSGVEPIIESAACERESVAQEAERLPPIPASASARPAASLRSARASLLRRAQGSERRPEGRPPGTAPLP